MKPAFRRKPWKAVLISALLVGMAGSAWAEPVPPEPGSNSILTEAEVLDIRKRVLRRCGLSSRLSQNRLPWYFHYEFGVELLRQGEAARAVDSLRMTANLRSQPQRAARMYGMWFVNYMPYYQMSLAWSELEEWDKAWDAIRMSEASLEFSPGDLDYEKFDALKKRIERHRELAS